MAVRHPPTRTCRPPRGGAGRAPSATSSRKSVFFRRLAAASLARSSSSRWPFAVLASSSSATTTRSSRAASTPCGRRITRARGIIPARRSCARTRGCRGGSDRRLKRAATSSGRSSRRLARPLRADGATIDIEPGQSAVVDDAKIFPHVRVTWPRRKGVTAIADAATKAKLQSALIEPEQISFRLRQRGEKRNDQLRDMPPHLVKATR